MHIDIGTIYLASALFSGFVSAVIHFGGGRSSRHNGLASLALATFVIALALALLGPRSGLDEWLTLGLGNTLLAGGALLLRFALDELHERRDRTRVPHFTLGFVWLIEWATFIGDASGAVRAAVGAFGTAVAFLLPVPPLLARTQPRTAGVHYIAGAAFLLGALASTVRGIAILADPMHAPLAAPTIPNEVYALATLGIVAAAGVAFLVMLREREVVQLAMRDGLTGVLNRRTFADQAKRVLALAQRRGLACSMVLVDLDHFSRINSKHGYRAGDQVLRQFVAQARGVLRQEDLLGRSGGVEFGMLLFATPAVGAESVARRLQSALAGRAPRIGETPIPITGTFGISEWRPGSEPDASALLHQADRALYEAKERGRNCIVCAAPHLG